MNTTDIQNRYVEAADYLRRQMGSELPRWAVVLGSGLGFFAEEALEVCSIIPYSGIPGFPQTSVPGHAGKLVFGKIRGVPVLCMQGRFHYYEGHSIESVVLPVRAFALLGIANLLLTNAAGGIRQDLQPGSLMMLSDHINLMGVHPLRGPNDPQLGTRFPDMTAAYDPELRAVARKVAEQQSVHLQEGVYLAVSGPSFETPAEIRAFRSMGADAVGMSTVPECIAARHAGMRVLGISCITNKAAGLGEGALTHEEVGETAARVKNTFASLLTGVLTAGI